MLSYYSLWELQVHSERWCLALLCRRSKDEHSSQVVRLWLLLNFIKSTVKPVKGDATPLGYTRLAQEARQEWGGECEADCFDRGLVRVSRRLNMTNVSDLFDSGHAIFTLEITNEIVTPTQGLCPVVWGYSVFANRTVACKERPRADYILSSYRWKVVP